MDISRTSVPGVGIMHDCVARSGAHFRVLDDNSGSRTLYVYGPKNAQSVAVSDDKFVTIDLDEDEADALANLLQSRPLPDRIADLERRVNEITGEES